MSQKWGTFLLVMQIVRWLDLGRPICLSAGRKMDGGALIYASFLRACPPPLRPVAGRDMAGIPSKEAKGRRFLAKFESKSYSGTEMENKIDRPRLPLLPFFLPHGQAAFFILSAFYPSLPLNFLPFPETSSLVSDLRSLRSGPIRLVKLSSSLFFSLFSLQRRRGVAEPERGK